MTRPLPLCQKQTCVPSEEVGASFELVLIYWRRVLRLDSISIQFGVLASAISFITRSLNFFARSTNRRFPSQRGAQFDSHVFSSSSRFCSTTVKNVSTQTSGTNSSNFDLASWIRSASALAIASVLGGVKSSLRRPKPTKSLSIKIPAALFAAVAQVLAYVYQLRAALSGQVAMPADLPELNVPEDLDPHHKPVSDREVFD